MTQRCIWCNRPGGDLSTITVTSVDRVGRSGEERPVLVHREHERDYREFNERVRRFGGLFLGLVVAFLMASILLEVVLLRINTAYATIGIGLTVALVGGLVLLFPFATPETVARFGARTSIRLARSAGVLLVAAGGLIGALPML